jgi:hypothetical protein
MEILRVFGKALRRMSISTPFTPENFVRENGWRFENYEGKLFKDPRPPARPLYRLNRFVPATGDLAHFYTMSSSERDGLVAAGWKVDKIEGYAYAPPTVSSSGPEFSFDSMGNVFVLVPGFYLSGSVDVGTNWACVGRVEVHLDGLFHSVLTEWSWGYLPGSTTTVGCYQATGIRVQAGQTRQLKLDYGGARATYTPVGATSGTPQVSYPSYRYYTLSR